MDYGLVKIVEGEYKGKFGLYDDDYENDKGSAVVYFGFLYNKCKSAILDKTSITDKYTLDDLKVRSNEIKSELKVCPNDDIEHTNDLKFEKELINAAIKEYKSYE